MRELEKLKASLDFCFDDWDIASLRGNAILQCAEYNSIHKCVYEKQYMKLKNAWQRRRRSLDCKNFQL